MQIAIPSDAPGGLDAGISDHFGHCDAFTLVVVDDGEIGEVQIVENGGHDEGGCMAPVMLLKSHDVDVLLAGGMGMRPLAGFKQVGISVRHKGEAATVRDAVKLFVDGACPEFGEDHSCGGGEGHCGGHGHAHSHEPIERQPIEGKADIRKDRVVTFEFTLKEKDGDVLDSSADGRKLKYIHGYDNIVPGLEQKLEGHEAGDQVVVELSPEDGFGERDDSKIIEIPRNQLPEDAEVGGRVHARTEQGQMLTLTVAELDDEVARLDANHPLAGKTVIYDVTIDTVEQATPEEIEHGRVLG